MTEQEFLEQLLAHMGCADFTVTVSEEDEGVKITLQVSEEDSGMLIGRKGETLTAIQRIVAAAFREKLDEKRVWVDINDYKSRRNDTVAQMALEVAARVKETNTPETLPPLSSEERRIVHMALREAGVSTASSGEGMDRRLTVYPEGYAHDSE